MVWGIPPFSGKWLFFPAKICGKGYFMLIKLHNVHFLGATPLRPYKNAFFMNIMQIDELG
jgi:hypothetical protein